MKLVGAVSTAVLSLSLGIGIPAYAQQEQNGQQEENKGKAAQEEKRTQPEKSAKPEERNAQQEKNKPEEKNARQQAKPEQNQRHAAGGRIPADRYKANFGREHRFRVNQGEYSSGRFQYGGYWFGFGGAWPSNWLYTQDVFVVEIDGMYYLCNPMYPGVNLAISVTL
jgi:hypothetical protein